MSQNNLDKELDYVAHLYERHKDFDELLQHYPNLESAPFHQCF